MITKASRGILSVLSKTQRSYYKIMRDVEIKEQGLPLYHSGAFKDAATRPDEFSDAVYTDKNTHRRFLKLVPFMAENALGMHNKKFVVSMELYPQAEALKIQYLNFDGVFTKTVDLKYLIPVIYQDFIHGNRRNAVEMPQFVDSELIYYNTFAQEFYLFDKEGQWDEKNIENPVLALSKRYNEKQWYDIYRVVG